MVFFPASGRSQGLLLTAQATDPLVTEKKHASPTLILLRVETGGKPWTQLVA